MHFNQPAKMMSCSSAQTTEVPGFACSAGPKAREPLGFADRVNRELMWLHPQVAVCPLWTRPELLSWQSSVCRTQRNSDKLEVQARRQIRFYFCGSWLTLPSTDSLQASERVHFDRKGEKKRTTACVMCWVDLHQRIQRERVLKGKKHCCFLC